MKMFRPATIIAAGCLAIYLTVDFGGLGYNDISLACKYIGILCCVYCAFAGDDPLLGTALLLTAICDYFLLFTSHYIEGVLLFIAVQMLHTVRGFRLNEIRPVFLLVPATIALLTGIIGYVYTADRLMAAAAAYGMLLLSATGLACTAYLRMKGDILRTGLAALGFLLFIACDVCVALFNLGDTGAVNWIWLFYLPSQWFLAASGLGWREEA